MSTFRDAPPDELAALGQLLGRPLAGRCWVVVRRLDGRPVVIENEPHIAAARIATREENARYLTAGVVFAVALAGRQCARLDRPAERRLVTPAVGALVGGASLEAESFAAIAAAARDAAR